MKTSLTLLLILLCGAPLAADEEERVWEGRWNNRKYNTNGPLKCVATETDDGTWKATFSGTFKGDPFSYEVTFQSKQARNRTDLAGKAVIRGHNYQWTGALSGNRLTGRYRSSVGYFGEFVLTESKD
jgi:hypothetical protein